VNSRIVVEFFESLAYELIQVFQLVVGALQVLGGKNIQRDYFDVELLAPIKEILNRIRPPEVALLA
jgi:hypothetical protein